MAKVDTCVCCGAPVPEGRMVCGVCDESAFLEKMSESMREDTVRRYVKYARTDPVLRLIGETVGMGTEASRWFTDISGKPVYLAPRNSLRVNKDSAQHDELCVMAWAGYVGIRYTEGVAAAEVRPAGVKLFRQATQINLRLPPRKDDTGWL